jgi:hypothetical protein
LLISEPEKGDPSVVMKVVKQRFSRLVRKKRCAGQLDLWAEDKSEHVWQKRFYDFNVWNEAKRVEKLRYIHRNPVKAGIGGDARAVGVEQLSSVRVWGEGHGAGELSGVGVEDQCEETRDIAGILSRILTPLNRGVRD